MFQQSLKIAACSGCVALSKKVEVLEYVAYAVIVYVLILHLIKWRNCRRNRARLASIRDRIRSKEL